MEYKTQNTVSKFQIKHKLFKTQKFVLLGFLTSFVWSLCVLCFVFSVVAVPFTVFALKPDGSPENLTEFVNNFTRVLNVVVPFIAGFGFFGFITGVLKYANAGGDEERLGKAKQLIAYGLLGMLVMFSFWGLAKILTATYLSVGV